MRTLAAEGIQDIDTDIAPSVTDALRRPRASMRVLIASHT
jgi:hypothetical protein